MTFLSYSIAAVVAFSGLFIGAFLARAAKEEMAAGSRYFPWMQKIIFVAIAVLLFSSSGLALPFKVLAYAAVILFLLRSTMTNVYPALGFLFFLLGQSADSLFAVSLLAFIYGFPTGSLFSARNRRLKPLQLGRSISAKYGAFVAVAIALQLLYSAFILKSFS